MKVVFVFIAAILMTSCAKLEFDEIAESPFNGKVDPVCSTYRNFESDGWHIVSLYFFLTKIVRESSPRFVSPILRIAGIVMNLIQLVTIR